MEELISSEHRRDQLNFISKFETEYTVLEYIGNGAFGTVYKCVPKKNEDKVVALKLIEIVYVYMTGTFRRKTTKYAINLLMVIRDMSNESIEARWELQSETRIYLTMEGLPVQLESSKHSNREAEILKKVKQKHENILEIISDWTEHPPKKYLYSNRSPLNELTNEVVFIETEFCDLKSLYSWFKIPITITELHAKILMYQIAKGLQYLHHPDNRIVHRDLKPENILLCSNEIKSCVVAKIGDFGISRVITVATMTKDIGTFCYKCPEVSSALGIRYEHKVDIYALGVIFCEMLILGECSDSELDKRDNALCEVKINEKGFTISGSCKEYLKDKVKEMLLIEEMVKLPGKDRPEASDVINKLLELCPDINSETIPIPVIPILENPNEFRLYGKDTPETFICIPATKRSEDLTTLDLNFVKVDAPHLISCLKECVNLRTIEMIVINEGDKYFPKIALPNLTKFIYRQLNGPTRYYSYITEEMMESLLFFGPMEQLWKNKMTVKVIITKSTVVDIQHEDSHCSICLAATPGTVFLYDNLKNFEKATSIYIFDFIGESEFRLELEKIREQEHLERLAIALPKWNDTVNQDLGKFENLKELYLSVYSHEAAVAGIGQRRLVVLNQLPPTIRNLTLSDVFVSIIFADKIDFDSLSLVDVVFYKNFTLEQIEDPSKFNVKNINFFINQSNHQQENIYEPTWELLDFLFSHEACKSFYFGSFKWNAESSLKEDLLNVVEEFGVPNNSQMFQFNHINGKWIGKVYGRSENDKLFVECRFSDKFMMAGNDEFKRSGGAIVRRNPIPLFQKYKSVEPAFIQDFRASAYDEYEPFSGLKGKQELRRVHLKCVDINTTNFVLALKGCGKLESLSMENVKVAQQRFSIKVDLPALKEFYYMLDAHVDPSNLVTLHFFDLKRMESTLFFNNSTFQNLWTKKINTLIGLDNIRVLEFNHEKGVIWIQCCSYASDIISQSGLLTESTENVKTFIIHDCSGLSELGNIPGSNSLTYLNLTCVDIDFSSIFDSVPFPCLQFLFLEPNNNKMKLDLCKIPPSVQTVGLTNLTIMISGNYSTCDCLTLKDCIFPNAVESLPLLKVRKIGLIGVIFLTTHYKILELILKDKDASICQSFFVKHMPWHFIVARAPSTYNILSELGLGTDSSPDFELIRNDAHQWAVNITNELNPNEQVDMLTGADIIQSQQYPT